jgi:hypothetical protein
MKRSIFILAGVLAATSAFAATFPSLTNQASPTGTDFLVGYRSTTDSRFQLSALNTYFSANVLGLTDSQITSLAWSKITSKPTTLAGYGITDPIVLTSGNYADPAWITSLAKAKVGLGNVDNTSDASKPVSTATQTALDLKASLSALVAANGSGPNAGNGLVHWQQLVGVPAGFADGSDDGSGGASGTVTSFSAGDLSPLFTTSEATVTTTPALTFALSNAAQNAVFAGPATGGAGAPGYRALVDADIPAALARDSEVSATYAPIASPTFTGTVGGITKSMVGLGNVDNTADSAKSFTASQVSDFNSAARAQVEAELIAGTNVTITPGGSGATRTLTIAATAGSGGYATVQEEGSSLTARTTVNFVGAGVTATDDGTKTVVTIPGGGGSVAVTAPTISSGTLTLALTNNEAFYRVALNANITTLTLSNPPASGTLGVWTVEFTADGTARTITWPASFVWVNNGQVAPTMTSTNTKRDLITIYTYDGGTTHFASIAGQGF